MWEDWYYALVFGPVAMSMIIAYFVPINTNGQTRVLGKVRPPGWVFAVAWTFLYLCIGSAWAFAISEPEEDKWITSEKVNSAWIIYPILLAILFTWTNVYNYSVRFGLYYLLIAFLALMCAYSLSPMTSKLLLSPMVIWLYFAGMMNFQLARKLR